MKYPFLVACFILAGLSSKAQQKYYSSDKSIEIYSPDFEKSRAKIMHYIQANAFKLFSQDESAGSIRLNFSIENNRLTSLDSLCRSFGYVARNNYHTRNAEENIETLVNDTTYLSEKIQNKKGELKGDVDSERRRALLTDLNNLEEQLKSKRNELKKYSGNESYSLVDFTMKSDFEMDNRKSNSPSFVNMPGLEYGLLWTENSKAGLSSSLYQGVNIKYLFTRGKSYFVLGAYKDAKEDKTDSARYSELFVLNFGQDFYPRRFGRGRNKFLNLYTGYQIGGFIANSNDNKRNQFIWNINASLGLELIKTKYILLDNRVSYFIPINDQNRYTRGLMYGVSFNFVF